MTAYACPICTASCTFEAMIMGCGEREDCPTVKALESGEIVDRRDTDLNPNFPSEFTYTEATEGEKE